MIYNLQNKDIEFLNLIFDKKINLINKNYFRIGSHHKDKNIYQFDALHSRILESKSKAQSLHIDSRICGIYPPTHIHYFLYLTDVNKNDGPTQIVPFSHKKDSFPRKKRYQKSNKNIRKKRNSNNYKLIYLAWIIIQKYQYAKNDFDIVVFKMAHKTNFSVPYSIPQKFIKKLNLEQKKILILL